MAERGHEQDDGHHMISSIKVKPAARRRNLVACIFAPDDGRRDGRGTPARSGGPLLVVLLPVAMSSSL